VCCSRCQNNSSGRIDGQSRPHSRLRRGQTSAGGDSRLAERLGISIIETCLLSPKGEPPPGPFDAVLVDVPCSNTGVLGRRPEARWKLSPRALRKLVPLQTKLLIYAAERVRPGGVIVYSTCSLEPEENRTVVHNVLSVIQDLELDVEVDQVPGQPADGGYYARIVRRQL
jgi:16S rRNA (cytosine967-C5)-methyltransferase